MINNPNVVSSGEGTDIVTIGYGIGVSSPETTFVNENGELITTQYRVVMPGEDVFCNKK